MEHHRHTSSEATAAVIQGHKLKFGGSNTKLSLFSSMKMRAGAGWDRETSRQLSGLKCRDRCWQCWIVGTVVNLGGFLFSNLDHGREPETVSRYCTATQIKGAYQESSIQVLYYLCDLVCWLRRPVISFLWGKWFLDHRGSCVAVWWLAAGIKLAAGLTLPHRIQVY